MVKSCKAVMADNLVPAGLFLTCRLVLWSLLETGSSAAARGGKNCRIGQRPTNRQAGIITARRPRRTMRQNPVTCLMRVIARGCQR